MQTGESSNSLEVRKIFPGVIWEIKKNKGNEFIFHHLPWAGCLDQVFVYGQNWGQCYVYPV